MAPPSPARLYATVAGATLFVLGLAGFFEDLSWFNFLYAGSGVLGLLLAGGAPRPFTLACGLGYTGLAIFAFDQAGWLHLAVGLLGLVAFAGTPRRLRGSKPARKMGREPRNESEPRAQAAGKGS